MQSNKAQYAKLTFAMPVCRRLVYIMARQEQCVAPWMQLFDVTWLAFCYDK